MYQALYRKYRPTGFDDVVGQEHVTRTLRRQIEAGRLSHAYLFVGTRGTGKTTCARILAKAANCEHPVGGNPCNECASCRGIDSGAILDVEELDAASNSSVDNIRALRDEAIFSPASVRRRVYIIDEVHMLSAAAFNALLKILEEPPEHIIFILATTEIAKVLPTILSRCQRFTFRRLTSDEIASRLIHVAQQEGQTLLPDAADLLARMADGAMRDGLSLLDQCVGEGEIDVERVNASIGLVGAADTESIADCMEKEDAAGALQILSRLYSAGKGLDTMLEELTTLLRDALVSLVAPEGGLGLLSGSHSLETVKHYAAALGAQRLISSVTAAQRTLTELSHTADKRTAAELCLIELCRPELAPGLEALAARVERLEAGGIPAPVQTSPAYTAPAEKPVQKPAPRPETEPRPVPQPAPMPEPVQVPPSVAESAPVPEPVRADPFPAAAVPPAADGFWNGVLEQLRGKLAFPDYMFLSDGSHTAASYREGVLILDPKTKLSEAILGRADVTESIRQAASALAGANVQLQLGGVKQKKQEPAEDKLDMLSKFGNVTMT
ncbi:MAG: DNA polymerase III subunit gamma/tau [Oscillospiraceae bacterium]|nr:DNA polymerase III subunit gamma/tau [Oscillospiraceae bacterium]